MTAYESIAKKIAPLNLYNTQSGTNIYNEICAYGVALDLHRELMEEALRECFISSAESYGIENREKVIGNIRDSYSIEERRKMLIMRQTLGENNFTKTDLGQFLSSFGVRGYQILEMPDLNEIAIYIAGEYNSEDKAWIDKQIRLVLPAHLAYSITFNGILWAAIDSKELTFEEMDSRNYSWEFIDSLL